MRLARKVLLLLLGIALPASPLEAAGGIQWEPWSDDVFTRAKKENKFVLLDLEAVWCHWCHVMDEKTYANPKVVALMKSKFIAVRVDQDSRPDLANRYEDYGWPATIVFNGDGGEIVKRRGYLPPEEMVSMLEAIIKDPTPGPSVEAPKKIEYTGGTSLSPGLRADLRERFAAHYDPKMGGWGAGGQKFLEWESVEYCMARAMEGDYKAERMARQTLAAQTKLIDPVWGGVYQYSTDGDWEHPHYEKIMQFQGENLRIFSMAFSLWGNTAHLQAAEDIHRFLSEFLRSPEGAFYTSMDADVVRGRHSADYFNLPDPERRKKGMPKVDKHIYSRENGWAITGLAALYGAVGSEPALKEAVTAADWIIANRSLPGGGFRHDQTDSGGPYLGDTLQMGRAFLALYSVTGNRRWLDLAEKAAGFIDGRFKATAGYATAVGNGPHPPEPQLDENVQLARFTNLLYHYTGKKNFRAMAEHAMRYLATPQIAHSRKFYVAGILTADSELSEEPPHITVVGKKDDPIAASLFANVAAFPPGYKRIEWWDKREGPLPRNDVQFPPLKVAAAFICADGSCSPPIFKVEDLQKKFEKLIKR